MPDSSEQVVVCLGYGSEYVFGDFAKCLRARDIRCLEIDMMQPGWRDRVADTLRYPRRILFTSQHPYLGGIVWKSLYQQDVDLLTLPEALELLSPERCYYVPHDFMTPIKDDEISALKDVTAALMPSDAFWYLRRITQVCDVGWIRTLTAPDVQRPEPIPLLLLPSEIGAYQKHGVDRFLRTFGPILDLKPAIKLPLMEGIAPFVDALQARGLTVMDAALNASVYIQASTIVVSNGLSSVLGESLQQGRATICLIDGVHAESLQRANLSGLDDLYLLSPAAAAEQIRHWQAAPETLPRGDISRAKPFDFEQVVKLIS
jgi:hypothetical protein